MTARGKVQVKKKEEEILLQWIQVGIHFFVSAVMSGALLFGMASPFGVAMVGASGSGFCGGAALLGASLGYMMLHSFSQGLRYLSSSILIFALAFCFYDWKILQRPWVMAIMAGLISAVTSFVYLNYGGWTPTELISYLAEIFITVVSTWAFSMILPALGKEKGKISLASYPLRIAFLIFVCAMLLSISGVMLWGEVSLGRILVVLVLLNFAWREGAGSGAILGLCGGMALDLASFPQAIYGVSWGFSTMIAGFFRGKSRLHCALAFLLANGTAVLWSVQEVGGILYEVLYGVLLFIFLPEPVLQYLRLPSFREEAVIFPVNQQDVQKVRAQLEDSAKAFRMLGETLKTAFRSPSNQNDVSVVYQRTAQKICHKCYLRSTCWEKEYISTSNSLNDVTAAMMSRGKSVPEDFPLHFAHRCLHFPQFLEELNLQLTAFLYRRQYHHRLRESRVAVCEQYGQISQLLCHTSTQISQELTPQLKQSKKLLQYLQYLGIDGKVSLLQDSRGMLQGEIIGEHLEDLYCQEAVAEISQLLQVPVRFTEEKHRLLLTQLEPFLALASFASAKKQGEEVCGDKSSYFKREDGKLFVLLCDGMGSGEKALGESTLAVDLLEQFLRAGVDTLQALDILNSALALRGEEGGGFSTVDLLELNLITAQGVLYKFGAAPSYYRRGGEIRRIVGQSMPAGADYGGKNVPDQIKLCLEPEDCLLMVSDGVSAGGEEDLWLCEMFRGFDGESMKEFPQLVLSHSPEGNHDDCSVVVVKLALREEL